METKKFIYTGARPHDHAGKVIKAGDTIELSANQARALKDRIKPFEAPAPEAPKAPEKGKGKEKSGKPEAPKAPEKPVFPKDLGDGTFELSDGSKHKASAEEAGELQKILDDEAQG